MENKFCCDWCGQDITVGESDEVVVVQCPKCAKSLMVPPRSVKKPPAPATNPDPTPASAAPVATVPASPVPVKVCPFCGAAMTPEATACKACGFDEASWSARKKPVLARPYTTVLAALMLLVVFTFIGKVLYDELTDNPYPLISGFKRMRTVKPAP
jgi:hypothetical protein